MSPANLGTIHPEPDATRAKTDPRARQRRSRAVPALKPEPARARCSLKMSLEAIDRIHVHARMLRQSPGEVIEALVEAHLKRFSVHDLGKTKVTVDRSESLPAA